MIPIVPAIIPKSLDSLRSDLKTISFSPEVHIDVVDGKFVPLTSWPYSPIGTPEEIKSVTDSFTLEVDLMVSEPLKGAEEWIDAGADMLVFHVEAIDIESFRKFVSSAPVTVGISALNDTDIDLFMPYIEIADYVQLMGIAKIGSQGQLFDERVIERIRFIKDRFPNKPISVDGSVNKETIDILKSIKVNRLIVGSAIMSAVNPEQAFHHFSSVIN